MTVHWYEGSEAFAKRALRIGDQAVKETAALLGVTETEPIDFFIYADDEAFHAALGPGTRENVGGQAHADIRTLFALIAPAAIDDAWVGIVVPHELIHLVFDTAVSNPYQFPPRWLNEGLAVYLSEGYGSGDRNRVADAVDSRDLLPLLALSGQFPTDPAEDVARLRGGVSAVDYLVRTNGQDALITLVRSYADGLTDDEAFTKAIGQDLAAFQAGWLAELGRRRPGAVRAAAGAARPAAVRAGAGPRPTSAPAASPGAADRRARPPPPARRPDDAGARDVGCRLARRVLIAGGFGLVIAVVVGGLVVARRRGDERHDRAREPHPAHPELAGHARARAPRPRLPHRGAARLRGPADPLHDPGADAARRDRARPPGAAGGPQAADPRPRGRRSRSSRRRARAARPSRGRSTTSSSRRGSRPASSR